MSPIMSLAADLAARCMRLRGAGRAWLAIACALSLAASGSAADGLSAWSQDFVRSTGTPVPVTVTIPVAVPTQAGISYTLVLTNGGIHQNYTDETSVTVVLDGVTIWDHDDVKHATPTLTAPVTLLGSNTLVVTLYGQPGDGITLNLQGTDSGSRSVAFASDAASFAENAGTVSLPVSLNLPSVNTVTVQYQATDGTALAGTNFQGASGTITFQPGQTQQSATLTLLDDGVYAGPLSFTMSLVNPQMSGGGNVGLGSPATEAITITNTDPPPTIAFAAAAASVREDAGSISLPVQLSAASGLAASFTYSVTGGTAVAGTNYQLSPGSLTILPGSTSVSIPVTILHDGVPTPNLTVVVTIQSAGGATIGAPSSETLTIVNIDSTNPTFTPGPNESCLENAGGQSVTAWATNISPSAPGRTVSFAVTTTAPQLFAVAPAVDASGTLSWTPAPDANGIAPITVTAVDAGGSSQPANATITILAVNQAPSFTKGPDQSITDTAGPQTIVNWATSISPGPANESTQTVTFIVSATNAQLFSAGPAVSSSGTLTYAPIPGQVGTAVVTVQAHDDGGTANGGIDTSAPQTFQIVVSPSGPQITAAATASPNPALAMTTLSVAATDTTGGLTYAWTVVGTPPAPVAIATPSAATTAATFAQSGPYTFLVTVTDSYHLSATSTVTVNVPAALTTIAVNPATATLHLNASQAFAATGYDQFGIALAPQPSIAWSVSGVGAIDGSGNYGSGGNPGTATITATSGAVAGHAAVTVVNAAPTVAIPPTASLNASGTQVALAVLGADDGGEANLTYTWSASPGGVAFTANGSNASKATIASLSAAGGYTFTVVITDAFGLSTSASAQVGVAQVLTSIAVSPATATIHLDASQAFTASALDQFGAALAAQPPFTWSSTGVGSVDAGGTFHSALVVGPATVTAASGGVSASAAVTVYNAPPTVAQAAAATLNPAQTQAALSVLGADDGGEPNLTYTWSASPGGVAFAASGTNAAQATTATFATEGTYTLTVTITDQGGLSTTSAVVVTVAAVPSAIQVTPANASLDVQSNQLFSATVVDQFGAALGSQPTVTWSVVGVGSIDGDGTYHSGAATGTATVTASADGLMGSAAVTVTHTPPTISQPQGSVEASGTAIDLSVLGASVYGESTLSYTWSTTATGVAFSANGTNASKDTVASVPSAASYTFTVVATDADGASASSTVTVAVPQLPTALHVHPGVATIHLDDQQAFSAEVDDQFGTALAAQPTATWASTGIGAIDAGGIFRSATTAGGATVTASADGLSGSATVTVIDEPPTVATPAAAVLAAGGTSATLSVLGADDGGEPNLSYTWSASPSAGVAFAVNGSNAAKASSATLPGAGSYTFTVTITDGGGLSTTSVATLTVPQSANAILVSPSTASLHLQGVQAFSASALDQFGAALAVQPTFAWSVSGVGAVDANGGYAAGLQPGTATVIATAGGLHGQASVTVTDAAPTVAIAAAATLNAAGTQATLTVLGADDGGESNLTYVWSGPAGVTISPNGSNAAKQAIATLTATGSLPLTVTITDAAGLTTTSTVVVVVGQVGTTVVVSPSSATLHLNASQGFSAQLDDQFGNAVATQPTFTWGASGVGSVDASGGYQSGPTPGAATVTATAGALSGSAAVTVFNAPPTVATAATAVLTQGDTALALAVLGADDGGEANLTYTWSASPSAGVAFAVNGNHAAQATTATLGAAGTYVLTATITDAFNLTTTSTVTVQVPQLPAAVAVAPPNATVALNGIVAFTATASDQFGALLAVQPVPSWTASGAGAIGPAGSFQAGASAGTATVTATMAANGASASGSASVTVIDTPPTITAAATGTLNAAGTQVALAVSAADDSGPSGLTYSWASSPAAGITPNDGNAASAATATLGATGTYVFTVTVADTAGLTATSSVTVPVGQVPTAITVSPANASLLTGASQAYSAIASDQFGMPLAPQPTMVWSISSANGGSGSITPAGILTAGSAGTLTVEATALGLQGTASATVVPTVAFGAASASAPKSSGTVQVPLVLSSPSPQPIVVGIALGGTAQAGVAYVAPTSTVTIPAGATTASIPITLLDDHRYDGPTTLELTLVNPQGAQVVAPAAYLLTITETDPPPTISFATAAITVNASAGSAAPVVVLSAAAGVDTTANLVATGTALSGRDYIAPATVTIPAGATSATIPVQILEDPQQPNDTTLVLALASPAPATLGTPSFTTITIHNDLAQPTVGFTQSALSVPEDAGAATLTVALSAPAAQVITVGVVASGSAAFDGAVGPIVPQLTFVPGQTSATIALTINPLGAQVLPDPLVLTLDNPAGAVLGSFNPCTVTITDITNPQLTPILEYVQDGGGGAYTAFFGYQSGLAATAGVPPGADNHIAPGAADQGQAVLFAPGRTGAWPDCAFSVPFILASDGSGIAWTLTGQTAAADANGPRPPTPPTAVLTSDVPSITITSPANGTSVLTGSTIAVAVDAFDPAGDLASVAIQLDGATVATVSPSPIQGFAATIGAPSIGAHVLTAVATTASGTSASSAPVAITVHARPTLVLTHVESDPLVAGAPVTLNATASEQGGSIASVTFTLDGATVATSAAPPFTATVPAAPAGSHVYAATATDAGGATATQQWVLFADQPPTVQLTSPTSGQTLSPIGGTIPLAAVAADPDGTVVSVSFQVGGQTVGTVTAPPYVVDWTPGAAGSITVTATATDNLGVSTSTAPVTCMVALPPTVAITAPLDGAIIPLGQTFTVNAAAADAAGSVASVLISQDGVRLAESSSATCTFAATPASAGEHTYQAEALDTLGNDVLSSVIHVYIDPAPTVAITAPAAGASFAYGPTNQITVTATASDMFDSFGAVDFFVDAQWVAQATTATAGVYAVQIPTPVPGNHLLTASCTDALGVTGFAPSVAFTTTGSVFTPPTRPTFQDGAAPSVLENCGPVAISPWAFNIQPAPGGTTVTFQVLVDNPALFAVQPAIDPNGGLTFTPATDQAGSTTLTITATDDGGTANGRLNTSLPSRQLLTIAAVNQPPSFLIGPDQQIAAGSSAQLVPSWATQISPGPANESWQTVSFQVSVDHPEDFFVQPTVDALGDLSYSPAPTALGTATLTVVAIDDGGTANGGVNASAPQHARIRIASTANGGWTSTSGPWTYASEPILGGTATAYSRLGTYAPAGAGTALVARDDAVAPYAPVAVLNPSAAAVTVGAATFQPGQLVLGPGPVGSAAPRYSLARWTAPLAGSYDLSIAFTGIDPGATCDVHVLVDGTDVAPAAILGTGTTSYTGTWQLEAGGTIDAVVGAGADGASAHDLVALSAAITPSAAPASVSFAQAATSVSDLLASTTLTVALSAPASQPVTVAYGATDGTALSGTDYLCAPGTVTIAPGATTATILANINDGGEGANRSFQVALSAPGAGYVLGSTPTATVTILEANHAPSFQIGTNLTVTDTVGSQAIAHWLTAISPGPADEAGQHVAFTVTVDKPALFSVQPAIDAQGDLAFTPAVGAVGVATISVVATDDGGTANGGSDTSPASIATITLTAPTLSVAILAPSAGTTYTTPATVGVSALTNDVGGTVEQVFYTVDGVQVADSTASPWQADITGLPPGGHTLVAIAHDSQNLTAQSAPVSFTVVEPLTLALAAPSSGAVVAQNQAIPLGATVSDSAYAVSTVQWIADGVVVGQVAAAPWTASWTGAAVGTHRLHAVAADAGGNVVATSDIALSVHAVPTVTLTDTIGGTAAAPTLDMSASAAEAGGSVASVSFFDGGTLLATVASAPYATIESNLAAGIHVLTAVATDPAGFSATSTPITVTVSLPSAPSVAITAPTAGSTVTAGQASSIALTAAPSTGATLTSIAVYDDGALIGTLANAPWVLSWTPTTIGLHQLQAVAADSSGASAASSPVSVLVQAGQIAGNPLSVAITAPAANAVVAYGAPIVLVAAPEDEAYAVTKVQFFAGTTLIGEADAAPWSTTWNGAPLGGAQLSAVATDAAGDTATSPTVAITVGSLPTISLNGSLGGTSANPEIDLVATVSDANFTIASVAFYDDGQLLGTDGGAPWTWTATNLPAGVHVLTAVVTDQGGFTATSNGVQFTLTHTDAPMVAITAPASGAFVAPGAASTLSATASAVAGATITSVGFYDDGVLVSTAQAPPYTASWSSTVLGDHAIQAIAHDSNGGSTISAPITAVVDNAPVVAWTAPANGAVVHQGAAPTLSLSAATDDGSAATVVVSELTPTAQVLGTIGHPPYQLALGQLSPGSYTFQATATDGLGDSGTSTVLTIQVVSAVSVAISSPAAQSVVGAFAPLPIAANATWADGSISSVSFFDGTHLIGTAHAAPWTIAVDGPGNPVQLADGAHTLTAVALDSLGLTTTSAPIAITLDDPPTVALTAPHTGATLLAGTAITLVASAADADGTVATVGFYDGATLIGTVTAAPWSVQVGGAGVGAHALTAVATDNLGLSTTSAVVNVTVRAVPTVAIAAPAAGSVLTPGQPTTIQVNAAASDSAITSITIYADDQVVATLNGGATSASWTPAQGSHLLTAAATDAYGVTGYATPVAVVAGSATTGLAVQLSTPFDQQAFHNGDTVHLSATVQQGANPIASVTFFGDGAVLQTRTAAPWAFDWVNATTGTHALVAQATDSSGALAASVPISIAVAPPGANQLDIVLTRPAQNEPVAINSPLALAAQVANAPSLERIEFYQGTTLIATASAPATTATWSSVPAGTWVITARAVDITGCAVSQAVAVTAATDNGQAPRVAITAPTAGSQAYADTQITGTVASNNPAAAISGWTLSYARADGSNAVTIATGTGPETGATAAGALLDTWDTSLVKNGAWYLTLSAVDTLGRTNAVTVQVHVAGEAKVGRFSFSQQDLVIPVEGMPLAVVRTYDSLNQNQSADFGYGWTYALTDLDVSFDDVRQDTEDLDGATFSLRTGGTRDVTLNLPTGQRVTFTGIYDQSDLGHYTLRYTAPPGTFASLTSTPQEVIDQEPFAPFTSWWDGQDQNLPIEDFDDPAVTLSLPDGRRYLITRDDLGVHQFTTPDGQLTLVHAYGAPHVSAIVQATGDQLAIGSNGITHYTAQGAATRSLVFQRDAQGRIVGIYDPSHLDASGQPNGPACYTYTYDTSGNLIAVGKLDHVDPTNGPVYDTTTFTLDDASFPHYITTITDPEGHSALRSLFDDSGRLIGTIDALGHQTTITHDLVDHQETVFDRNGNPTVTGYDARGNVTAQTDALGNTTSHTYDANNNVLSTTDPLGRTTTMTYDGAGRVLSSTDALGNVTRHTYDALGDELTTTTPMGEVTTRTFDAGGRLLTETDPLGNTTSTAYDAGGHPIRTTDALGNVTTMAYDGSGNLTSQVDAAGTTTTFTYDGNGNQLTNATTRTTSAGVVTMTTTNTYDSANRLVQAMAADGSTTATVYTPNGQVDHTVDQLGHLTRMTYDSQGQLVTTTTPDGVTTTVSYDANGNRLTSTIDNQQTIYAYDIDNRLTTTTAPDGGVTTTAYDAAGQVASTTDALNHTTTYAYDADGRRTGTTNALNQTTTMGYDADGRQTSMTDALNQVWSTTYDADGRATVQTFPDNTTTVTAYDADGRKVSMQDQAGKVTQYAYDALGRLISVTDALNHVTTYGYDEVGNEVSQTDANFHQTVYEYDNLGRRTLRTLPAGQSESWTYDAAGRMQSHTDANVHTTTYAYDAMGRELNRTGDAFFGSPVVSYTYTPTGQRQSMADATGETTYTYDPCNRLLTKVAPEGTLTYTYDLAGNLASTTSSNGGGTQTTYTYDALNRMETAGDPWVGATTLGYDAVGNLHQVSSASTAGATLATTYGYDHLNRLTSQAQASGATTLSAYQYTLGPAGNRLQAAETARTVTYAYDATYRLTSESVTLGGSVAYSYDNVGNRLTRTSTFAAIPSTTATYDADDRLGSDSYDADGNTLGSTAAPAAGATDTYDFENRLVQRNLAGAVTTIAYDGDGNKVSETSNGVTTIFLIDTNSPTGYAQIAEEMVNGAVTETYVYGLDRIAERSASALVSYYGYDGHGNVRQLVSGSGAVTDSYTYDAFGMLIASTGSSFNRFRYCGEEWDANLGMYNLRARWMEPGRGRFWNSDTYGGNPQDPRSLHKYLYSADDPANHWDPSGHDGLGDVMMALSLQATIGAAISGGFTIASNFAQGLKWNTNLGLSLVVGAIALPLSIACPPLGIALAAYGIATSGAILYNVLANPNSSSAQIGVSVILMAASLAGGAVAYKNFEVNGWVNPRSLGNGGGVKPLTTASTLGDLMPGVPDDAYVHLTPAQAEAFSGGFTGNGTGQWVRFGDVKGLTLAQYQTGVVGPMAAGSTGSATNFIVRMPNPANGQIFQALNRSPNWLGVTEYRSSGTFQLTDDDVIIRVQKGQ